MAKNGRDAKVVIPSPLIEAVKSKRAILFLGAGASKESKNSLGQTPPDADQLRDILAQRFFGVSIKNRDVTAVAEMAIASSGGAQQVFETVRQSFEGFEPSNAHKLISAFNWRMIATTNYDLLVERAFSDSRQRLQTLVRFVKDDEPIEEKLQAAVNPVPYLKLHGCLDHIFDNDIPLVLSREQYESYSANRTRLFNRLKDFAQESAIVFIGYRLDDAHVRELIYKIGSDKRPRWYIVTPDAQDYDTKFWATRNIEVLKCRFGEFMTALDAAVPPLWRSLSPSDAVTQLPIRKFFVTQAPGSATLRNALVTDVTFVHSGMAHEEQTAKLFYAGYDTGWGGIINRLDVRRKVEDDLLYKALLEIESPSEPLLLMLRGAAGSGKTIALKRTAYEAATASDALVLWHEESGALHPNVFLELYDLCKRPIYLFIDQVALQIGKLHPLLKVLKSKNTPLIIVGAERESDWNTYCSSLDSDFPPQVVRVGNLSESEVQGLLDLLDRHNCLGLLKDKPREQQINEFMKEEKADRQLLVALHELTQGKPFEEIVLMEHQRVHPERARQLYLDIATMHQFGVKVRAGTISRISGIEFNDYREHFFAPLQEIVKVEIDKYTLDYCYKTRHARIAYLVFQQICTDDESKARQIRRLIEGLDAGYSSDRRALEEMSRGRALAENFSGVHEVRAIYETATKAAPKQAFLYQQWAIFESTHPAGSLLLAEARASQAHELDPGNMTIIHTQAEIDRKRAYDELSLILKESLRRRARARLNAMPSHNRFVASSRCKLLVDEATEIHSTLTDETKPHEALFFAEKIRDAEDALFKAQQEFSDDADIIQVEARLLTMLGQDERALKALERAWASGPRGSRTAIRIAKVYEERDRFADALNILKEALARDTDDKAVHQAIALHYLSRNDYDASTVEHHLRKSFSSEDHNFEERYMLAQFLFLRGDVSGAGALFEIISRRAPSSFRRTVPQKDNAVTKRLPRYTGSIEALKEHFFFIRSGIYPQNIFGHHSSSEPEVSEQLSIGQEVNFRIRFNRAGPAAVDVRVGRNMAH